jgi:hypothetical protein
VPLPCGFCSEIEPPIASTRSFRPSNPEPRAGSAPPGRHRGQRPGASRLARPHPSSAVREHTGRRQAVEQVQWPEAADLACAHGGGPDGRTRGCPGRPGIPEEAGTVLGVTAWRHGDGHPGRGEADRSRGLPRPPRRAGSWRHANAPAARTRRAGAPWAERGLRSRDPNGDGPPGRSPAAASGWSRCWRSPAATPTPNRSSAAWSAPGASWAWSPGSPSRTPASSSAPPWQAATHIDLVDAGLRLADQGANGPPTAAAVGRPVTPPPAGGGPRRRRR